MLRNPKISHCYQQSLTARLATTLPAGSKINTVTFTVTPGSGGGSSNVVATGTGKISVTANGKTVVVYTDVAFITGNRLEATVTFESLTTAPPAALLTKITNLVATRAAKA